MMLRNLSQATKQAIILNKCIAGTTRSSILQPTTAQFNLSRRYKSEDRVEHLFPKDFVPIATPPPLPKPEILGAILPWSEQVFIQKLFLPYTYSVMYYMDFLTGYMPWWAAIVATTATIKVTFLPLLVKQQQVAAKTHNLLPETQKLQVKINDAMVSGDTYSVAMNRQKLKILYAENNLSLKDRLWPVVVQIPMFMSLFFLLRTLSAEVAALKVGGTLWFTDLTVPDPYYLLPLVTSATMLALMEFGIGAEGASGGATSTMRPIARWGMRCMPVILFAFIHNFPAATLLFWSTNNFLTLVSTVIINRPGVKKLFKIPNRIKHDPASLPLTNQSLSGQFNQAKEMSRASRTTMDLRRLDDLAFRKAGVGPLRKTYKTPPAQHQPPSGG